MRLNTKDQLGAILTALSIGATDYEQQAARCHMEGNLDGQLYSVSRAVFLRALANMVKGIAKNPELDEPLATFTITRDQLDDISAIAGVRVREVLDYRAADKGEAQFRIPPESLDQ